MKTRIVLKNVFVLAALVPTHFAAAQNQAPAEVSIHVQVESKDAPTKAVGLLLSTSGTEQIQETTINKEAERFYDVSFIADGSKVKSDTVATAIAFTSDGQAVFSNVTPALLSERYAALNSIPECAAEDVSAITNQNQLGPLRSLVEVRTARSDLAHIKVSKALDADLLERLKKFETAFGLTRSATLDADLAPQELVDRLARLNFAIKEYKSFKKQSAAQNQANTKPEQTTEESSSVPKSAGTVEQ